MYLRARTVDEVSVGKVAHGEECLLVRQSQVAVAYCATSCLKCRSHGRARLQIEHDDSKQ